MNFARYRVLAPTALAALQLIGASTRAAAQDSAATVRVQARTHTVRRGDTLWDLSRSYLGDPFLWPEIYRLNTAVVENPHWIYPGERLTLPARAAFAAGPPSGGTSGQTVFAAPRDRPMPPRERLAPLGSGLYPAVRPGEVYAAPFVDRDGGPARTGRIREAVALSNVRANFDTRALLLNDEVYITPPAGRGAAVGERYLTFTLGARLERIGQVVVPTGVVQVERADAAVAPRARLTQQFGRVLVGQQLIPLEADLPAAGQTPSAVADGAAATVVWIDGGPVLPSLQRYVVLDHADSARAKVGDEITLLRPPVTRPGLPPLPEERLGVAQIVRVTPHSVTAVIVGQDHPAIRRGTRGRITAKMP